MDTNDKKRSMAHFVQAQHIRTRERLAKRTVYPVPQAGDIIIFNEQRRFHEKHDSAPERGVGCVTGICGYNVILKKMYKNQHFFDRAISVSNFELGLYTFVKLNKLPDECPLYSELEIGNLSEYLKCL